MEIPLHPHPKLWGEGASRWAPVTAQWLAIKTDQEEEKVGVTSEVRPNAILTSVNRYPLGIASAQTVSALAFGTHQHEPDSVSQLQLFKA